MNKNEDFVDMIKLTKHLPQKDTAALIRFCITSWAPPVSEKTWPSTAKFPKVSNLTTVTCAEYTAYVEVSHLPPPKAVWIETPSPPPIASLDFHCPEDSETDVGLNEKARSKDVNDKKSPNGRRTYPASTVKGFMPQDEYETRRQQLEKLLREKRTRTVTATAKPSAGKEITVEQDSRKTRSTKRPLNGVADESYVDKKRPRSALDAPVTSNAAVSQRGQASRHPTIRASESTVPTTATGFSSYHSSRGRNSALSESELIQLPFHPERPQGRKYLHLPLPIPCKEDGIVEMVGALIRTKTKKVEAALERPWSVLRRIILDNIDFPPDAHATLESSLDETFSHLKQFLGTGAIYRLALEFAILFQNTREQNGGLCGIPKWDEATKTIPSTGKPPDSEHEKIVAAFLEKALMGLQEKLSENFEETFHSNSGATFDDMYTDYLKFCKPIRRRLIELGIPVSFEVTSQRRILANNIMQLYDEARDLVEKGRFEDKREAIGYISKALSTSSRKELGTGYELELEMDMRERLAQKISTYILQHTSHFLMEEFAGREHHKIKDVDGKIFQVGYLIRSQVSSRAVLSDFEKQRFKGKLNEFLGRIKWKREKAAVSENLQKMLLPGLEVLLKFCDSEFRTVIDVIFCELKFVTDKVCPDKLRRLQEDQD
ncbi:unnamed protein product [Cyprideis torosa]|uniref:Uncharacterized protein n=1 Tax=Cyprideis torosa TaxID=163714 RepID=A0A7R8W9M9_9CRUS|nr:unnamed protein product [Cyprideis torosa]CAG0884563.1 unnamed protein product [Cyprideis torosa]